MPHVEQQQRHIYARKRAILETRFARGRDSMSTRVRRPSTSMRGYRRIRMTPNSQRGSSRRAFAVAPGSLFGDGGGGLGTVSRLVSRDGRVAVRAAAIPGKRRHRKHHERSAENWPRSKPVIHEAWTDPSRREDPGVRAAVDAVWGGS